MPCHTHLSVNNFWARMEGWEWPCIASKTVQWNAAGRGPVEMSAEERGDHGTEQDFFEYQPGYGRAVCCHFFVILLSCGHGRESTPGSNLCTALIIVRASATSLLFPAMCLLQVVYSDIAAMWRYCRVDHGSDTLVKHWCFNVCAHCML